MKQEERLYFLIKYLINEPENYLDINIPEDIADQKPLLRALMNIRPPKGASEKFIRIQNEYLQTEINKKGITDQYELTPAYDRLFIWQGDITTLKCGAIVNAANRSMRGCFVPCHGCIDNAIHTYAGIQLRQECDDIMNKQGHEELEGQAKITRAYNLPCDYIIHTVGPVIRGAVTKKDRETLRSCYIESLKKAEQYNIKSIAFCCISTGEFHFPNEEAARIAVSTVREYLKNSDMERVIFNVFKDEDRKIYEKLLG